MPHGIRLLPGNAAAVRHGNSLQKPVKRPLPVGGEGLCVARKSWWPCRETLYIVDYLSAGQGVAGIEDTGTEGIIIFGTPAMVPTGLFVAHHGSLCLSPMAMMTANETL
jgi:hypothetical protein